MDMKLVYWYGFAEVSQPSVAQSENQAAHPQG